MSQGDAAAGRGRRRRRRAVGPAGALRVEDEPLADDGKLSEPPEERDRGEDDRLRADRPPHHDRGV